MGASVEVGESSGVFADEHDASVTSVTTRATTSRHARKIMGRPYVQTPKPETSRAQSLRISSRWSCARATRRSGADATLPVPARGAGGLAGRDLVDARMAVRARRGRHLAADPVRPCLGASRGCRLRRGAPRGGGGGGSASAERPRQLHKRLALLVSDRYTGAVRALVALNPALHTPAARAARARPRGHRPGQTARSREAIGDAYV